MKTFLANGYRFSICGVREYYTSSSDVDRAILVGIPPRYWDGIHYVSLWHQDILNNSSRILPLEFDITNTPVKRDFSLYNISVDDNRRNMGEGVEMVKGMARLARKLGFDEISLVPPFLDIPQEKYTSHHRQTADNSRRPNTLDWFARRFTKLGDLRSHTIGSDGKFLAQNAVLPVAAIL